MQIEQLPPSALNVSVNNSRTHSVQQIEQIAASMTEFGFTNPILIDEDRNIIAGHGRRLAAEKLGKELVPCVVLSGLTEVQKRAYLIADNQLPLNAGWNLGALREEIEALADLKFDIDLLGFDSSFLDDLLADVLPPGVDENNTPDEEAGVVSVPGDVWQCGPHRVMCGDSTNVDAVATLCDGELAQLLHADPPYGMGKQKDGVENDNLYREKLDEFQSEWWDTFRTFVASNATAYIWGNAPDLWRWWYVGGLADSEELSLRNEIVWDKKSVPGMASDLMTQYPEATERCLFIQIGDQFIGNVNSDQYWPGWDEIRLYLEAEAQAVQLTPSKCREATGVQMFSHWFTKSQWAMIPEARYQALAEACPGNFERPYAELRKIHDRLKGEYQNYISGIPGGMRAYFDNTHDNMRDVWDFPRVVGDERHDHATPKPVEMMERVMKSSLPRGGLCLEPFGGSGSTLIGAEVTGRRCFTMELTPKYVDTIVRRWQKLTGGHATHAETGLLFDNHDAQ